MFGQLVGGDLHQHPIPAAGQFHDLRLRIRKSGEITVINERNGFNKSYQVK